MRIGIDARELQGQATGVGRYLRSLLQHWTAAQQDELLLYFNGQPAQIARWQQPGLTPRILGHGGRGLLWQEGLLPAAARADDLDVFFAPAYWCPLRLDIPRVTAVHDLACFRLPEDFHWREAWRRRLLVGKSLGASAHVLTISDFSRREILALRPELAGRVTVTPLGADDDLAPAPGRAEARARLGLTGPLLLTVGSLFNRRRLPELLRAVARLRRGWPGLRLEIVGDNRTQPRLDLEALVRTLGLAGCVRLSGFLDEAALAERYAAADLAIFLSVYEGFGLPAIEAASRGVALVVSHHPALGEIFGSAAAVVDPEDIDGLAVTLHRLLARPSERAELAARGLALARRHTWADTARRTREVLASTVPERRYPRQRRTLPAAAAPPPASTGLAAVLVSYNTRSELLAALASLDAQDPRPTEVWVVDNASTDGSAEAVRAGFPDVRLIANDDNLGFGAANNQALARIRAPFVLLLNPDAELPPGALGHLLEALQAEPDLALVGPLTRHSDGAPQVSFGPALGLRAEWRQRRLVNGVRRRDPRALAAAERLTAHACDPEWISASCWLARTEALRAQAGFDPAFFLYEEDVDLCLRLRRAGWRLGYRPSAQVMHRSGGSMARRPALARLAYQRSHLRYYERHCGAASTLGLRLLLRAEALAALCLGHGPADAELSRAGYARALLDLLRERGRPPAS